jgi:hypothetical protein
MDPFGANTFLSDAHLPLEQGCQMVSFQTKAHNLGKFWRALDWKMLIYFMAVWNILPTSGIFYDHFVHFVFILVYFSGFGIMHQKIWQPCSRISPFLCCILKLGILWKYNLSFGRPNM